MHRFSRVLFVIIACTLVGIVSWNGAVRLCGTSDDFSLFSDPSRLSEGYVLAAVFHPDEERGKVFLIGADGNPVHTWNTEHSARVAYLQESGHVYVALADPAIDMTTYPASGSNGIVQELDWDGNVVWEYQDSDMTHDFEVMSDGGVAYLRWYKEPTWFANRIVGGIPTPGKPMWSTEIVVVNREKEIVWTWRPEHHIDPRQFPMNPLTFRDDWSHANSIRYTEKNPVTGTPAFLTSIRNVSTVFMLDATSGKVIWNSPEGALALQHDATFTDKGTILVFDNGMHRQLKTLSFSRVVEFDPLTSEIVWEYNGGKTPLDKGYFYSSIMSGAERLQNGNTFITESMNATLLEVTPEGDIAWKFTSEFRENDNIFTIFKARKYDAEGTEWEKKIPFHFDVSRLVCANG